MISIVILARHIIATGCDLSPSFILTEKDIPAIAEVNADKFGAFTLIPIVSEAEARAMQPGYFLVLPWHFKEGILVRGQEFIAKGGKLIFPFEIEII
jgi:hypothetical protein